MSVLEEMHQAHVARQRRLCNVPPLRQVVRREWPALVAPQPVPEPVVVVAPYVRPPTYIFVARTPFDFYMPAGPEAIISLVAAKHRMRPDDILRVDRSRRVHTARTEAVRLVRTHCEAMSFPQIGRIFRRHHASIMNMLGRHRGKKHYGEFVQ